jgi:phosphatidylserine/phosphatidylglycerophosphate/cardiolipin synthase-like enzyme
VYAVTGTNTVSFGMVASDETKDGLLGYAVRRHDLAAGTTEWMPGFKVFKSLMPAPTPDTRVSTHDQPVQSFVWDDFTCQPDSKYRYEFHPLKGTPSDLDRSTHSVTLTVRTEPLSGAWHDVYFNRGVASSQYYTDTFGDTPIDQLDPATQAAALAWLSRDLGTSLLRFIDDTQPGDRLLGCFYEFSYEPAADALKNALDRGVDVRLVIDMKQNEADGKGSPRDENQQTLTASGFPMDHVVQRQARKSAIAHNKFMVHVPAGAAGPTEVWTGSTNLTRSGIAGQTNVGDWLRDPVLAASYLAYWDLLSTDPGGKTGDSSSVSSAANKAFEASVEQLSPVPGDLRTVAAGATPIFSPRAVGTVLDSYAALLAGAEQEGCITFAFGVDEKFKDLLKTHTSQSPIVFMLLETRDEPDAKDPTAFVKLNSTNNVYEAWGSYLQNPVYQWAQETNAGLLGITTYVNYVHSKFMVVDPLGDDPIVITGSANFSNASTVTNDENMVVIRGDRRTADIYLTEFNRIWNHYYFRSVTEVTANEPESERDASIFLAEDDAWTAKYLPGTLKSKRLALYEEMTGFTRG